MGEPAEEVKVFGLNNVNAFREARLGRMVGEGERTGARKRKKEEEEKWTKGNKKKSKEEVTEEKMRKESEGRVKTEAKMKQEEQLLNRLEDMPEMEEEDELCEVFSEEVDATRKVTTTLRDHYSHWKKTEAPGFSLSVIKEGYKITLEDCPKDLKYEEKNNKSYNNHKEFADEVVAKME